MTNYPKFQSIFITGQTGVGKTFWAKQKLKEASTVWENYRIEMQEKEHNYSISSASNVIKSFNSRKVDNLAKGAKYFDEYLKQIVDCAYVLIDDLWVSEKVFTSDIIYLALDERIEKNKATIVTSNLSIEQISDVDDRLASRLSSFKQILLKGEDLRITTEAPETITVKRI